MEALSANCVDADFILLWQRCVTARYAEQTVWREREDQQDATIKCLLLTSVSTCFGHHYAHLQENKRPRYCIWRTTLVLLHVVGSGCGGLHSPEDGHNNARKMLRQKLIINIWLLNLVGFLSLHTLLTMHGHRNLKPSKVWRERRLTRCNN